MAQPAAKGAHFPRAGEDWRAIHHAARGGRWPVVITVSLSHAEAERSGCFGGGGRGCGGAGHRRAGRFAPDGGEAGADAGFVLGL